MMADVNSTYIKYVRAALVNEETFEQALRTVSGDVLDDTTKDTFHTCMMTSPSASTNTIAFTQAPQPWKIARKAYCGKKATANSTK